MTILIKNGHVLDPKTRRNGICDVLIDGDRITKTEENITVPADKGLDDSGCYVRPGFRELRRAAMQSARMESQ